MKSTIGWILSGTCLFLRSAVAAPNHGDQASSEPLERRQGLSFEGLKAQYYQNTMRALGSGGGCNAQNAIRRQEWGDMSPQLRQEFIAACHCLASQPARTPRMMASGAISRWDDFVVTHIINNEPVHVSAFLLTWHRNLGSELEQALRNECGYSGGLPYIDFTKYEGMPLESWPAFDGSPISLGGNGVSTPDGCSCVRNGPFADWVVNLGPSSDGTRACSPNRFNDLGLNLNRRCLERRFDPSQALPILSESNIVQHILNNPNAASFAPALEALPAPIHSALHDLIGGLQEDVAAAPAEPIFFLLHCFLDFVWAIWQSFDYASRSYDLAPSQAWAPERQQLGKDPPPQVDLQSPLPMTPAFPNPVRVGDIMSTFGGKNCYIYQ